MASKKTNTYSGIGGQAVLEGVMMKGPDQMAVAVRKSDGEIVIDKKAVSSVTKKVKFHIQDNTGELGKGTNYRSGERENLYKAFDIGAWWLQDALEI